MPEDLRLLFVYNFNTGRDTIYFGYVINKIFIHKGYFVLELLFEKLAETMHAYNNITKYIRNTELTKVVCFKDGQIEVEPIHFWHSTYIKNKVVVEIKMPR